MMRELEAKRRLARIMRDVLPIPLTSDAIVQCDELAAKRVVEAIQRERAEREKAEKQFRAWVTTPKRKRESH